MNTGIFREYDIRGLVDKDLTNEVVEKHMSLLESTGFVSASPATVLTPPAPHGPITTQLVIVAVVLVGAANLALAARRSWT